MAPAKASEPECSTGPEQNDTSTTGVNVQINFGNSTEMNKQMTNVYNINSCKDSCKKGTVVGIAILILLNFPLLILLNLLLLQRFPFLERLEHLVGMLHDLRRWKHDKGEEVHGFFN